MRHHIHRTLSHTPPFHRLRAPAACCQAQELHQRRPDRVPNPPSHRQHCHAAGALWVDRHPPGEACHPGGDARVDVGHRTTSTSPPRLPPHPLLISLRDLPARGQVCYFRTGSQAPSQVCYARTGSLHPITDPSPDPPPPKIGWGGRRPWGMGRTAWSPRAGRPGAYGKPTRVDVCTVIAVRSWLVTAVEAGPGGHSQ